MKFRFYQLMYVASLVLTVLALLAPVVSFSEPDGAVAEMTNFKYVASNGEVSWTVIALGIVLIFTAVVNLFFVYTLVLSGDTSMAIGVPMLYPFIALTLNLIAFLLLRRCEAKIIAKALGFRLRD